MTDSIDVRLVMRHSQESPCNGAYTILVPEDRQDARPLTLIRATGVALARGTYRLRIERVGDA